MPIHVYRLVYHESPQTPERLWEWERPHIDRLLWNAKTFHCEVVQRYVLDGDDLAQENQRLWETHSLSHGLYQPMEDLAGMACPVPRTRARHAGTL
jgi:hypothetical protein